MRKNKILKVNELVFTDKEKELDLYEMANVIQSETGLPVNIYISAKNANHDPRIKAQNNYSTRTDSGNLFSVTISDNPQIIGDTRSIKNKDIEKVKFWVILNKKILLDYWNKKEESTKKVLNSLKKVT